MRSRDVSFNVSEVTQLSGDAWVAGSLHLPDRVEEPGRLELLLCLHGGGYRRSYWHPPFGDDEEYSFARFFTDRGKAVLALDQLGMGDSSRPEPESVLSRMKIAQASACSLAQAVTGLRDGTWAKAATVAVTGVGHSIGGMMIITQAAEHGGFERVAVLGWANQPLILGDTDAATLSSEVLSTGYLPAPRGLLRSLFYLPDVPKSIVEADEATATRTPSCLGRDALTAGIVHTAAASISVPVMIVYGAIDTSPNPWGEVSYFKGSQDVTLCVLPGSAHCHNLAATRRQHWERLDRWIDCLPAQCQPNRQC